MKTITREQHALTQREDDSTGCIKTKIRTHTVPATFGCCNVPIYVIVYMRYDNFTSRSFDVAVHLPSLEILCQQRLLGRATLISQDTSHPAHDLFEPLPSSRRFRSIKTRTNRFSTSFFPLAVQALSNRSDFLPPAANT